MNEKLTPEQEKLVTDNMKLVYFHFNKLQNSSFKISNKDDLISEGMIGLIKAAKTFDPTKCKFATYATRCIMNEFFMFMRKVGKEGPKISLSTVVGQGEDGTELTIGDTEAVSDNSMLEELEKEEENKIKQQLLNEFLAKRKPRDREILALMGKGMKQREISKQLGLSQSYISRIFQKIKNEFEKFKKKKEDYYAA